MTKDIQETLNVDLRKEESVWRGTATDTCIHIRTHEQTSNTGGIQNLKSTKVDKNGIFLKY